MFLSDLNDDELESIANHTFSNKEDVIQNMFFEFRVKLLCQGLPFHNDLNKINCTSIPASFIKSTLSQFNYFYHNSRNNDFIADKALYQNMGEDFDNVPQSSHIRHFIETITDQKEKALALYAFGLIIIWDKENSWTFFENSNINNQQTWFALFYSISNSYFLMWEPLIVHWAVNATIRNKNSKAAKAKHKNSEITKKYAIKCYSEKNYKSVRQAALNIATDVIKYGNNNGFDFSSDYQAVDTIYKWLLKYNKAQK